MLATSLSACAAGRLRRIGSRTATLLSLSDRPHPMSAAAAIDVAVIPSAARNLLLRPSKECLGLEKPRRRFRRFRGSNQKNMKVVVLKTIKSLFWFDPRICEIRAQSAFGLFHAEKKRESGDNTQRRGGPESTLPDS